MLQAVDEKRKAEDISSVLYPNDATEYGKELRLKQQFFFVSASIQVSCYCIAVRHIARGSRCANYLGNAVSHPDLSVLCSIQDVMARYKETGHKNWKDFPSKACFQMNDTHPTIAVAELMRLLIDQEGLDWEEAWSITTQVCLLRHR